MSQEPSSSSPQVSPPKISAKFPEEQQACQDIIKTLLQNSNNLAISKKSELSFVKGEHSKWQHNETRILKCNGIIPADKHYDQWKDLTFLLNKQKQKSAAAKKIIDRLDVKCQYQPGQLLETIEDLQLKGLIKINNDDDNLQQDTNEDNKKDQSYNNNNSEDLKSISPHKRVLLFWSSWCAGSAELLQECSIQLSRPNTDIFAISMDHELSQAQEESKYSCLKNLHHQYFGGQSEYLKQVFQSDSLPKICLADSSNHIVYIGHPACLTNEIIQRFNEEIQQSNIDSTSEKQDEKNIPEQTNELITKAEYDQLKQFLRGKLKEVVSKSYWHMKGSFKLSLSKITNYEQYSIDTGVISKSVQYFKGLLQYDCEQNESQDILKLVDWISSHECAKLNIDIQGNIASDEIIYENFQAFAEYLCNTYSNKLKFNRVQNYSIHMSTQDGMINQVSISKQLDVPSSETVVLQNNKQSQLNTHDAATFGLQLSEDLELFKSQNCQQNLAAFEQLFWNGIKYSWQHLESFMSFGYLNQFNPHEENNQQQQFLEISPILETTTNKAQIILCWSSWNRESLLCIADIAQKIKEFNIECIASTVLIEGDNEDEGLRGLLHSIKEFKNHYKLALSEEQKHYSQLVFDVFDVPYVIVVNQDNQIEFAEPFKDVQASVYVKALKNKNEDSGVQKEEDRYQVEKNNNDVLKITEDIRGLVKQELKDILVVMEQVKEQGIKVDVNISFNYVTPFITGEDNGQDIGSIIEEQKDGKKDNQMIPQLKQDIPTISWYSDFTAKIVANKAASDNQIDKKIIEELSKLNLSQNYLKIEVNIENE